MRVIVVVDDEGICSEVITSPKGGNYPEVVVLDEFRQTVSEPSDYIVGADEELIDAVWDALVVLDEFRQTVSEPSDYIVGADEELIDAVWDALGEGTPEWESQRSKDLFPTIRKLLRR